MHCAVDPVPAVTTLCDLQKARRPRVSVSLYLPIGQSSQVAASREISGRRRPATARQPYRKTQVSEAFRDHLCDPTKVAVTEPPKISTCECPTAAIVVAVGRIFGGGDPKLEAPPYPRHGHP